MLDHPDTKIRTVTCSGGGNQELRIIQDDLLHPILGGNKLRKLDALMPALSASGFTDLVTCGGLQSAHTAAVASACAERGITAHLLVRGERPALPTGYHLLTRMFGQVTYISRAEYADRQSMFDKHVERVVGAAGPASKVRTLQEGAAEPLALLGLIRLVRHLSGPAALGRTSRHLVTDCGTGATAIGLALGVALMGLPWKVHGVMLAGSEEYYNRQQQELTAAFTAAFAAGHLSADALPLHWRQRVRPRKFGAVLPGDVATCRQVAQEMGILLDPIYSLAAWEVAEEMAGKTGAEEGSVAMLHSGGMMGLFGVAQRFPDQF
ncbi:g9928 [Coccomyxa elongata]